MVVAYNAASTLEATLERIPSAMDAGIHELLIFDDASADDTFKVASAWASRRNDRSCVVVRHQKNLGYGGNQKAAYAIAQERGLDVVVLLHGDGQYDPAFLPDLIRPIVEGRSDAVFGSRMMVPGAARSGGMPLYKWYGNKILTGFENRMLGTDLTEFHSGYRAYRVSALAALEIQRNSDDFDFDTQIIIQLVQRGFRILEVPIPTYYGDEICYVNGLKYAKDVVKDVFEYRLSSVGLGTAPWVSSSAEYDLKDDDSSHQQILRWLSDGRPRRILDLGCSGGRLAERLRRLGHRVTGVDVIEVHGVRSRVDEFVLADLTRGVPDLGSRSFDCIIAADVLEHVPSPLATLRDLSRLLCPGGEVILSTPNFGHWYPRSRVLTGTFGYDRRGILDETHLRFFTRRSLRRMIVRAGFDVVEEGTTPLPLGALRDVDGPVAAAVKHVDKVGSRLLPRLCAYQFLHRLVPHSEGSVMVEFSRGRALPGDESTTVSSDAGAA